MRILPQNEKDSGQKLDKSTKTIGILGGMGPAGTVDFYRRLVESTQATCDQEHLRIFVDSYPQIPDRTEFLLGRGESPVPLLISRARMLEELGADLLVIACNTANVFHQAIQASVNVPLINWGKEVSLAVVRAMKDVKRVGLLATTGTIISNLYQDAFTPYAINVVCPILSIQEEVMNAIYGAQGVKSRTTDLDAACLCVEHALTYLCNTGVDVILLACTEISLLFSLYCLDRSVFILDASQLVAERIVVLAGGQRRTEDLC